MIAFMSLGALEMLCKFKFPHSVTFTKEKMHWSPWLVKNEANMYRPGIKYELNGPVTRAMMLEVL